MNKRVSWGHFSVRTFMLLDELRGIFSHVFVCLSLDGAASQILHLYESREKIFAQNESIRHFRSVLGNVAIMPHTNARRSGTVHLK